MASMTRLGFVTILLAGLLAAALPLLFAGTLDASLAKLGIPGDLAVLFLLGILVGAAIDVPLRRIPTSRVLVRDPLAVVGLGGLLPHLESRDRSMTVALNVGGGLIPLLIAAWEIVHIVRPPATAEPAAPPNVEGALIALAIAVAINVGVCWKLARPISGVGIAVPGFVPAVLAAATSLIFAAEMAPPVALVAGVVGPLVGGAILRLRGLGSRPLGLASIGGGGTYDAVLLSVVLAAYLG